MDASVIYTSLYDKKHLLKLFLWEGTYLKLEIVHNGETFSLRNTSRMQNVEFEDMYDSKLFLVHII